MMKRGTSGLCGILAIDKPYGVTSHDVVDRVRRITGERRVGHAGTLDPAATGLMLVGVGAATRLSEYLIGHDKEYDARIVLGVSTDTDDAQGRVFSISRDDVLMHVNSKIDPQSVLDIFTGELEQLPPAYSAIKKNGVVAYKAAREGTNLELEPRRIHVYKAELINTGVQKTVLPDGQGGSLKFELPYWDVHFVVSKGTYIRALARDIGVYLECGAHLGALCRTAVATTNLETACALDELENLQDNMQEIPWCDPAELLGFPIIELDAGQVTRVQNGRELDGLQIEGGRMVSCVSNGKLLAVYSENEGAWRPATVIPGGVVGVGGV